MNYFDKVHKAIQATQSVPAEYATNEQYCEGWHEVASDLQYGVSCGSEHAVWSQINLWTGCLSDDSLLDNGDLAYATRTDKIYNLIQSYTDNQ